ncbi:MAG: hypothetical protein K5745_01060 [Saccharofermentans sp.]|nr:hypothetical protein [Saccharofermentans sp.]
MINKIMTGSSNGIEMNIVCSDYSLLENINGLLSKSGVIGVRDSSGQLHYIVDGRKDRLKASKLTRDIVSEINSREDESDAYYDTCAKNVFHSYGLDLSKIGAVVLYEEIRRIIYSGNDIPPNMKAIYIEATKRYSMTYSQIERDVRYALRQSRLAGFKSRHATRLLINAVKMQIVQSELEQPAP